MLGRGRVKRRRARTVVRWLVVAHEHSSPGPQQAAHPSIESRDVALVTDLMNGLHRHDSIEGSRHLVRPIRRLEIAAHEPRRSTEGEAFPAHLEHRLGEVQEGVFIEWARAKNRVSKQPRPASKLEDALGGRNHAPQQLSELVPQLNTPGALSVGSRNPFRGITRVAEIDGARDVSFRPMIQIVHAETRVVHISSR